MYAVRNERQTPATNIKLALPTNDIHLISKASGKVVSSIVIAARNFVCVDFLEVRLLLLTVMLLVPSMSRSFSCVLVLDRCNRNRNCNNDYTPIRISDFQMLIFS